MQSPQKSEKSAAQTQQESQAEWEPQQESQTEWECPTHTMKESPGDRFSTVDMQQDTAAFRAMIARRVDESKFQVIQHMDQLHSEFLAAPGSEHDQQKAMIARGVDHSKSKVIQHIDQLHSEFLAAPASEPDQQKACLLRLLSHLEQFDQVVDS